MKLAALFAFGVSLSLTCLAGCGKPGLGDDCDKVAVADECDEGFACAQGTGTKPVCEKLCNTTADCASNQDCVAVTGSETATTAVLACQSR